jgi:hypothetical protein
VTINGAQPQRHRHNLIELLNVDREALQLESPPLNI